MDVEAARKWIHHAQDDLDQALAALDAGPEPEPPEPPSGAIVTTPEEFDAALASATDGTVIVCATSLVYTKALVLAQPDLTIQSEHEGSARITPEEPAPLFTSGITVTRERVSLVGLEIRRADLKDILTVTGTDVLIDRCRILGDPVQGAKRGIAANGPNLAITRCHIDDCFGPYPGNDCQAISGWLSEGPTTITDNYISGGTESIMFGGGDPPSEADCPCDITIKGNTITKNPGWQSQAVSVKNTLELKNARRVRIEDNEIEYSWGGHGQDGYLLMLTPRNQEGNAPYSTVEDVIIRNNVFRYGAGAINVLGTDNNHPSGRLSRVTIEHNRFEQIDCKAYTGSNKMILISAGPTTLTIDDNEFLAANVSSVIYFTGSPQCVDLVVTNNEFPVSKYGVFGDNTSVGNGSNGLPNAWNKYVASGTYSGNTLPPASDPECAVFGDDEER